MKIFTLYMFLSLFMVIYIQAQDTYCGLTYYYDADGNRIQRIVTSDCSPYTEGGGGGGDGRMLVITDTTTQTTPGLTEALFPNPTTGPVSVVFNQPVTDAQVTITDNLGRQLYRTTTSGSSIPLDMSNFADGLYYIVVRTEGNKYQSTVVKQ